MQYLALSALSLALLGGCSSASAGQDPPSHPTTSLPTAEQTLSLNLGAQARLADGSRLTYLRLVNDSRCPPGVQCIWAGDAEIELRWEPAGSGKSNTFSLHTSPIQDHGQTGQDVGNLHIALQTLERGIAPKATLRITAVAKG